DLAVQRMAADLRTEAVAQRCREIAPKILGQLGQFGQIGGEQLAIEGHLRVSEQDRQLGTDEPATLRRPLRQGLVVRQEFERTVEPAGPLEITHQADLAVEYGGALPLGDRQSGT